MPALPGPGFFSPLQNTAHAKWPDLLYFSIFTICADGTASLEKISEKYGSRVISSWLCVCLAIWVALYSTLPNKLESFCYQNVRQLHLHPMKYGPHVASRGMACDVSNSNKMV